MRAPKLYLLAAAWWREVLGGALTHDAAIAGARRVLSDNAAELYRL